MKIPCKAKLLNFLIEAKEFRIIPTPIWRNVQTNTDLPVESRFLWTVLWELCAPNPNFEKPLTWSFLSKRLGKSESTIRRWARSLQKSGYLEISYAWGKDGGQLPCMFRIGVPIEVAEKVAVEFPDRKKKPEPEERREDEPGADNQTSAPDNSPAALDSGAHAELENSNAEQSQSAGVIDPNPAQPTQHAESAENVLKIGATNGQSRVSSRLNKRIDAIGKGSNRSHTQRSDEKRSDVPDQTDRFSQELLEISRRASKMGAVRAEWREKEDGKSGGEGASKSVSTLASTFGTQENNPAKQENNKNQSLRSIIRRALVIKLGVRQDIEKLVDEFAVSIEKGAFKKFDLVKALNIGVKLVREGRWMSPRYA